MFRSLDEILGYKIRALDGELGKVKDFYYDDRQWIIRYLVVDTGHWISGRQVLISPVEVDLPDWVEQVLPVQLTREQIEKSPPVDLDMPLSRQREIELAGYYGWPFYWGVGGLPTGTMPLFGNSESASASPQQVNGNAHLRSVRETIGYTIEGQEGRLGSVEDFIANTDDWMTYFLVANLSPHVLDKRVLLSPRSVENLDWEKRTIQVSLNTEQINNNPEFDPHAPVNWQLELHNYDYYGRPQ